MPQLAPLPNLQNLDEVRNMLTTFFDGNKLQKEKLRLFLLDNFEKLQKELDQSIYNQPHEVFWTSVQNMAALSTDSNDKLALAQIKSLPKMLSNLIKESVSSYESFEFYILSKAAEISSNDKDKDYFYALKVRHDQLLAFLYVLTESLNKIYGCLDNNPQQVIKSADYQYFKKGITTMVYEIAQKFYEVRTKLGII